MSSIKDDTVTDKEFVIKNISSAEDKPFIL